LSKLSVLHSAETCVKEPGDLWTAGLPKKLRDKAFCLERDKDMHARSRRGGRGGDQDEYIWVTRDGRLLVQPEDTSRQTIEGTTSEGLLAVLDRDGISGAVLYPSIAMQAFSACSERDWLDAFFDVYNKWILALASAAPHRLKAVALLNVDDPPAAVRGMHRLADRGAAGFVLPLNPGEGYRYDQPRYEVLWRTAAELGRPLSLLAGAHRHADGNEAREWATSRSTLATRLAFKATSVFPARRSITAITYAGVFERYPALRIGVVGFGAGWAAYAMVRADEIYEVRPERTGPLTRVMRETGKGDAARHLEREAGVAIASDDRSGTRGMAPEGVGYHFPAGERFSDHFRRNVFLTFDDDALGIALRGFIGIDGMLWGHRLVEFDVVGGSVKDRLSNMFARVPDEDRHRLVSANTARIYGFDPLRRRAAATPLPLESL
jgi:predicted TIM-barrel fold metal-dependent hydrolase